MIATSQNNKVILEFDLGDNYNKKLIDLLLAMETANKSGVSEDFIRELAEEAKKDWWQKNKNRFFNEIDR
jgi:hypothetical protein